MKIIFNYILFICILCFISCTKLVTTYPTTNQNLSQMQLMHASPNVKGIRIWIDDTTEQQVGNYFKSNSHYLNINPGKRKIEVKLYTTDESIFVETKEIKPDAHYSLFASDSQGNFDAFIIEDNHLPIKKDMAQLRIVNCLSTNECINATSENIYFFNNIKFKHATNYQYFSAGEKKISITNSYNHATIIENALVYLDPGVIYTLYVNGFSNQSGTYSPDAILVVNH